jgi:hypothetical protein
LAAGQAVQLREQLLRVARNAQGNFWPEYADLDCFACHHSLTNAENSWQQKRGYPPLPDGVPSSGALPAAGAGRHPGNPPWNLSRYAVLREVVSEVDPDAARELESNINRLYGMISSLNPDRVHYITRQGERAAEQSAMALQVLYTAYAAGGKPAGDGRIPGAIALLFKQVENPSAYDAFKFADLLKALGGLLP